MRACLALLALLALGTALTLLSTLALQAGWVLLTHGASRLAKDVSRFGPRLVNGI